MKFRKRPKLVEASQVKDIVSGTTWPYWLREAISAGKIHVQQDSVNVIVGRQIKVAWMDDWIAYDPQQQMVYCVSKRTMATDYEQLSEETDQGTQQPRP